MDNERCSEYSDSKCTYDKWCWRRIKKGGASGNVFNETDKDEIYCYPIYEYGLNAFGEPDMKYWKKEEKKPTRLISLEE